MTVRVARRWVQGTSAALMVAGILFEAPIARATDPGQCVDANAKAQGLRRSGKFTGAREQLRICVRPDCPAVIRDDCAQRLEELERLQPTVVFDARDGSGNRLVDVTVLIDGQPFAQKLDGTALPVEPGPHMFTFEAAGKPIVGNQVVINEGEKARHEPVQIGPVPPPVAAPPPVTAAPVIVMTAPVDTESHNEGTAQRGGAIAIGILGLGGIGAGAALGVIAQSDSNASKSDCSTGPGHCPNRPGALAEYNNANTAATISNIGFIGGGVLVAGAIVLFATAPSHHLMPAPRAFRVVPAITPQGGGMTALGTF